MYSFVRTPHGHEGRLLLATMLLFACGRDGVVATASDIVATISAIRNKIEKAIIRLVVLIVWLGCERIIGVSKSVAHAQSCSSVIGGRSAGAHTRQHQCMMMAPEARVMMVSPVIKIAGSSLARRSFIPS